VIVSGVLIALILWWFFGRTASSGSAVVADGEQTIEIMVEGGYSPEVSELQADTPSKLIFKRRDSSSCLEEVVIPDLGISAKLPLNGEKTIELPPLKQGEYEYSCGMRMFHGKLVVK